MLHGRATTWQWQLTWTVSDCLAPVSPCRRHPPYLHPFLLQARRGGALDGSWVAGQLPQDGVPGQPQSVRSARPLFLLTNASTASASEVLAGALRDNGRARLVGERTFGKGVVQGYFGEPDGSGLKLTVAKYITPSG